MVTRWLGAGAQRRSAPVASACAGHREGTGGPEPGVASYRGGLGRTPGQLLEV